MKIYKTTSHLLNSGVFYLGYAFRETKDIWLNGRAWLYHRDLENKNVKVLSLEETNSLRVYRLTNRSKLFIFNGYTFHTNYTNRGIALRISPFGQEPYSLTVSFLYGSSLRVAKGIIMLAVTIFTLPIWGITFVGVYLYNSRKTVEQVATGWKKGVREAKIACCSDPIVMPQEPVNSHVTRTDVLKIGRALVGYRHVSTEVHAQYDQQNGINNGSSLNVSFCGASNISQLPAVFQNLDERVARGESCDELVKDYEKAITKFIIGSTLMDVGRTRTCVTYADLFATLNETRFMVVKTSNFDTDTFLHHKLGYLRNDTIPANGVTLLRRLVRNEIALPLNVDQQPIISPSDSFTAVIRCLASHYRCVFLEYIRNNFDPTQFHRQLSSDVMNRGIARA